VKLETIRMDKFDTVETDTTIEFKQPTQSRQAHAWPLRQYFYSVLLAMKMCVDVEDAHADGKMIAPLQVETIAGKVMTSMHPNARHAGTVSDSRAIALHNVVAMILQNYHAMFVAKEHKVDEDGVPLEPYDPRKSYQVFMKQFDQNLGMPVPPEFVEERKEFVDRVEELRKYSKEVGLIDTIQDDLQVRLRFTLLWDELRKFLTVIDTHEAQLRQKEAADAVASEHARADAVQEEIAANIDRLMNGVRAEEADAKLREGLQELEEDE